MDTIGLGCSVAAGGSGMGGGTYWLCHPGTPLNIFSWVSVKGFLCHQDSLWLAWEEERNPSFSSVLSQLP